MSSADLALSWSQNASALFSALALAENQRAEWDTWMCWLLADKLPGKDETTTSGELAVFQGRLKPVDYQKVMDSELHLPVSFPTVTRRHTLPVALSIA